MEGAVVILVFAVSPMLKGMSLGKLVVIEIPEVSEGLSELVLKLRASAGKVFDKGLGRGFTGEGKDDYGSVGKSIYRGDGHDSSGLLSMAFIDKRG
jgi:hypothetical protein